MVCQEMYLIKPAVFCKSAVLAGEFLVKFPPIDPRPRAEAIQNKEAEVERWLLELEASLVFLDFLIFHVCFFIVFCLFCFFHMFFLAHYIDLVCWFLVCVMFVFLFVFLQSTIPLDFLSHHSHFE